jgi:predicted DNA-binding transcriptional regulator AlpA
MTTKLLVNDRDAAEMLGCGRSTFRNRVKAGMYPAPIKHGSSSRWLVSQLVEIAQASLTTRPSAPDAGANIPLGCTQP